MESHPEREDRRHHEPSIFPRGTITSPFKPENQLIGDDEYAARLRELAALPKTRINVQGLSGVIFALTVPMPIEFSILHGVISLAAAMPGDLFDIHCEGRILRPGIHKLRSETTLRIVLKHPNQFTPFNKIAILDIKTRVHGDFLIDLERPYDSLVADIKVQIQGLINRPADQFQLYFGNRPIESGFYLWCYGIWDKAPVVLEISNLQFSRSTRDQALFDFVKAITRPDGPLAILPSPTANDDGTIPEAADDDSYDELYDDAPESPQAPTEPQERQSLVHAAHEQQYEQELQTSQLQEISSQSPAEDTDQIDNANPLESQNSSAKGKSPQKPKSITTESSQASVTCSSVSPMTAESPSMRSQESDTIPFASTSAEPTVQQRSHPASVPYRFDGDALYSDGVGSVSRNHLLAATFEDLQNTMNDREAFVAKYTDRPREINTLAPPNRTLGQRMQADETAAILKNRYDAMNKRMTPDLIHSWAKSICYAESTDLALISGVVGLDHIAGATKRIHKILCKPTVGMLGSAEIMLATFRTGVETVKSIQFGLQESIPLPDFKATWLSDGKRTTAGRYGRNDIIRFDMQDLDASARRMCAVLVETNRYDARVGWVTLYITKLPPPRPPTPRLPTPSPPTPPPVAKKQTQSKHVAAPPVAKKQAQRKEVPADQTTTQPIDAKSHPVTTNITPIPAERALSEQIYVGGPSRPPPRLDVTPRAEAAAVTEKRKSKISKFAKSLMRSKKKE